ncbi:hypothetical protein C7212DRAFT_360935 [Tuber magnatum]|uniref:DUF6532 domain-containing protein n=1 Tax=Tuber magnatum TaxID=42249 RepID=A0A317T1T2_9PEZI|nr:hypothetical protein C7212DRAFT_360935 [Tuber magnatum]
MPQPRPIADTQCVSKQHRQKRREVRDGGVRKSRSKETLAGSMRSGLRRSRAGREQVSSQFHVPQPHNCDDRWHNTSTADESEDSQDREYVNGTPSVETAEELIESGEDDELGDYGAQRVVPIWNEFDESQSSALSFAVTPTQTPGIRIGLPGRKTPASRVSRTSFIEELETSSPAESVVPPTPIQREPGTTRRLEQAGPQLISSRRNMAVGVELTIQTKARDLMWDWTLFVNLFPDPVILTEQVHQCWSVACCELGLPNFADAITSSDDQIRAKHSSCRSQYLHTAKRALTNIYKLETDDPAACAERAEYLLEKDRFTCTHTGYGDVSLRFLAPEIPEVIYAHFYSGRARRGWMDDGFLRKINGRFLCLTTAIICHALRCWRTGIFTDNINFTRASSRGLLERQFHTWANTPGNFQNKILGRIRKVLEAKVAQDRGTHVERTEGYSDNLDALRREFGIDPESGESQPIINRAGNRGRDRTRGSQAEDAQPGAEDQSPAVDSEG